MLIQNALIYTPEHTFRKGTLFIKKKRIEAVFCSDFTSTLSQRAEEGKKSDSTIQEPVIDAKGAYAIPGLIDIHLHGCMGVDISDLAEPTTDDSALTPSVFSGNPLPVMADYLLQNGITGFTPATMTLPHHQLEQIFRAVSSYQDKTGARFLGVHMEGPFFSEKKKGAQAAEYLRLPSATDFFHYQELSDGRITQADVAPELPGAIDYIRQISPQVTVSLGHSAASYQEATAGFEAGASHVTHLFNGMLPFAHRDPGLVGAAADRSDVFVEMIGDGIHIHPAMIRAMFRLFGPERILLISDSMRAAGMPDGFYTLGGQRVFVQDGKATLSDGTIAGSAVNLLECLKRVVSFGIPLADAVRATSENQARELGRFAEIGSLESGKYANIVLLNPDLSLRQVILEGELLSVNGISHERLTFH